jgi:hypothetical protein
MLLQGKSNRFDLSSRGAEGRGDLAVSCQGIAALHPASGGIPLAMTTTFRDAVLAKMEDR